MTNAPVFLNVSRVKYASSQLMCPLMIDVEEDFDWLHPKHGTPFSTAHARNFSDFEDIVGAYGAVPTYLVTYPILCDPDAVRMLRRRSEMGRCVLGIQLHTWVTPPVTENDHSISFATNLAPNVEEQKLIVLKTKFEESFGYEPKIFRSGRYGISASTLDLLEKHGFMIDTSLAPRSSFVAAGGPDFSAFDYQVFWFGKQRRLLELPLCRSLIGWGTPLVSMVYQALIRDNVIPTYVASALTRVRFAERVTFSPEGNDSVAIRRLVRSLIKRGENILALSLHSSSLAIGNNPYVRTTLDLHDFYEVLSATLDFMAGLGAQFPQPLEIHKALLGASDEAAAPS